MMVKFDENQILKTENIFMLREQRLKNSRCCLRERV